MESARSKARGCPGNEEFGPEIGIRLLAKKVAPDKSQIPPAEPVVFDWNPDLHQIGA
jgi:hypothetical protein